MSYEYKYHRNTMQTYKQVRFNDSYANGNALTHS